MKGKKEKRDFDQNIGLHEVFLESVPSTLILFVIGIKAGLFGKKYSFYFVTVSHVDSHHYTACY